MQWVARIQDALAQDGFRLRYQPILPLTESGETGRHYEILLCMEDDDGLLIPPGIFLPAAERYDLMPAIDRWVVRSALSQLAQMCRRQPECHLDTYAINLSGASLNDADTLAFLRQEIQARHVLPQMVCFDITESAALANLPEVIVFMEELKALGCRFALDDFGSGLSSFAYLRSLPVDFLKIDGSLVKDIIHDAVDRALVASINDIGHVMGMKTVAELVEDGAIRAALVDMGVDYAQGYGIARPAPFEELLDSAAEG
jgi:EAL domain-containing protein (putative c-di-GMP-specific phosphodiesterase class I)